jgi:hypothetical protein
MGGNGLSKTDLAALAAVAECNIATNKALLELAQAQLGRQPEPDKQPERRRVVRIERPERGVAVADVLNEQTGELRRFRFERQPDGEGIDMEELSPAMMPDHDAGNAASEIELAELAARVGCRYVKAGLSPPFRLHEAVRHWGGLSHDEVMAVIERHFDSCRRFYTTGSSDQFFYMVEAAIHKAIESKHPSRGQADAEPERPRRRSASRVHKIYNAGGPIDAYVEGHAARLLGNQPRPAERPSGPAEGAGPPANLEDDAPREDA